MVSAIALRTMKERPPAGVKVIVLGKDGRQYFCTTTMVYHGDFSGVIIYHRGKAINEDNAAGWWPVKEINHVIER